eukprot:gene9080-10049_t
MAWQSEHQSSMLYEKNGKLVYDVRSMDLSEVSVGTEENISSSFSPADALPSSRYLKVTHLLLDHNDLKTLPSEISEMKELRKLSAIGNQLLCLPESIGELRNLIELSVDENDLSFFPETMSNLENLEILSAVANKLTGFEATLFPGLVNLKKLYLDENDITELPSNFAKLKNLQWFECSENMLEKLPETIGNLKVLEVLDLESNNLSYLPSSFAELPRLKILLLTNNNLGSLPETMLSAKVFEKLCFDKNDLRELPAWFSELESIEELSVNDNELADKPFVEDFCKVALQISSLSAGRNYISSLPENIGMLKKLTDLHLGSTMFELERSNFQSGNWLSRIPESFVELVNLKKVHLDENQITELPCKIGNLVNLEWLDLGQNQLENLPDSICQLGKLTYLQLSKNRLRYLPDDIGKLVSLIELRLDCNLIAKVPMSIVEIKGLQALDLFDNKLSDFPEALLLLNNLKRLDLDCNNFSTDAIPRILPMNCYPERDEALKDNWRGKTRPDKVKCDVIQMSEVEVKEADEETCFNENVLRSAMRAGTALWRKHDGTNERETFSRINNEKADEVLAENCWVLIISDDEIRNERTLEPLPEFNIMLEKQTEDWDEDLKNDYYQDTINVCNSRKGNKSALIDDFQNSINRYPPCKFAFSQTACYDSMVYKKPSSAEDKMHSSVEEGQFADADDEI